MQLGADRDNHSVHGTFVDGHVWRLLPVRYALTLLAVLAAVIATMILDRFVDQRPTLFLLFAAIVFSGWIGGLWAAIFAALLSIPSGLYFYSHRAGAFDLELQNFIVLPLFMVCAAAGGWLSAWQRKASTDLALKARQLEETNQSLRAEMSERRRAELALLETRSELARAARLTTMGELAASIAHEINQPLAAIAANAGACIRWACREPPELGEVRLSVSRIARDAERAAAVVSRVRQLAQGNVPEKSEIDLNRSLSELRELLENEFRKQKVKTTFRLAPDLPAVIADRIQMQQVFMNLFMNAIEAMSRTPQADRGLLVRSCEKDGNAMVEIQDSGAGFEGNAEQLFEPFYSTKPSGMGLGLAICRSIIEAHGGSLSAECIPAGGALFRVLLPVKAP